MALQALIMPLVAVLKGAGFGQATKALRGLDGEFKQVAKSAAFAAINFAAAGSIQKLTQYFDEAVSVTQKYERNILALNQTFQAQSGTMREFTRDAAKMGVSQSQAAQASVFLGSVLKQYGLESSVTAGETQKLIGLSQDLATTYGYDLQEALLAMTALFRGEYDPIEKFGVAMKQNEINALLAERGQAKLTGTMQFQAQVQARLDLLYMRSADSMGAFERATGTLYSAQQLLNASLENQQIAFGTPLQEPIAELTNVFNKFMLQVTPAIEAIGTALGAAIGNSVPLVSTFFNAIAKLVDITGKLATAFYEFDASTKAFGQSAEEAGGYMVAWSSGVASFEHGLASMAPATDAFTKKMNDLAFEQDDLQKKIASGADTYGVYEKALQRVIQETINLQYLDSSETALKRFAIAAERSRAEMDRFRKSNAAFAGIPLDEYLRGVATAADEATGNVSTLSDAFASIDEAIRQSEAKDALEGLGLSAGLIERVLTEPNWEEIFGKIRRLAILTAIDIASISNMFGQAQLLQEIEDIDKFLSGALTIEPKKTETKNKQAVDTIFDSLKKDIMQQTARLQLEQMTNSEGLINMILGREDWLSLWIKIKKSTTLLSELEDQFYKTGAGAQELADAIEAWKAYDAAVLAVNDRLEITIANIVKQAEELKLSFTDLLVAFDVLPTIAVEMGRFESAIVSQLASIEAALQSAFRNGDLFEEGYNALRKFAKEELAILQARQRQRDDMASRLSFSEQVIKEYTEAFTGAMQLTALFDSLKDKTEKRTVTEVTTGVAKLSKSLREFNTVVTREYKETITNVIDKTAGLLDGFKQMSVKAKAFADNLRTLKDMGLDGQLFDQLVSAGVEAGGETAQALVDGGQETVSEISSIFAEVNALGATLGEEVATTLYGTGIDLADGLIEGILSKQEEMETAAYAMAEAFNKAFQATLSTEVDKVTESRKDIERALAKTEIGKIPIPDMPRPIDSSALDEINNLIAGANKALSGKLSSVFREGITGKLGAFEALKADIVSGQLTDLGGVTRNLTSAKLETVATATGGTTVNNYYEIKAGTRSETLKTVETLASFTNQNGTLKTFVTTQ